MTAVAAGPQARSGRTVLFAGIVMVVVVVVVLLVGRPPEEGPPLGAETTGPAGLGALVVLLEELGADVDVLTGSGRSEVDGYDVVFVPIPSDGDDATVDAWLAHARAGGRLVVAGELEGVTPAVRGTAEPGFGVGLRLEPGGCDLDDLQDVGTIEALGDQQLPLPVVFDAPEGSDTCYPAQGGHYVVRDDLGDGDVVSVGAPGLFALGGLGAVEGFVDPFGGGADEEIEADDLLDNSVVAARLLRAGSGVRIALVEGSLTASAVVEDLEFQGRSPIGLMSNAVKVALLQILVAAALYLSWRGRRLGHPVVESEPVHIAGSEFVAASGDLMQRYGHPGRASAALRQSFRRSVTLRLGLTPDTDTATLADVLTARTTSTREQVVALLEEPVTSEAGLLALARDLERTRLEVLNGHR